METYVNEREEGCSKNFRMENTSPRLPFSQSVKENDGSRSSFEAPRVDKRIAARLRDRNPVGVCSELNGGCLDASLYSTCVPIERRRLNKRLIRLRRDGRAKEDCGQSTIDLNLLASAFD